MLTSSSSDTIGQVKWALKVIECSMQSSRVYSASSLVVPLLHIMCYTAIAMTKLTLIQVSHVSWLLEDPFHNSPIESSTKSPCFYVVITPYYHHVMPWISLVCHDSHTKSLPRPRLQSKQDVMRRHHEGWVCRDGWDRQRLLHAIKTLLE